MNIGKSTTRPYSFERTRKLKKEFGKPAERHSSSEGSVVVIPSSLSTRDDVEGLTVREERT